MAAACPVPFPFLGNVLSTDWFLAIRARLATVMGRWHLGSRPVAFAANFVIRLKINAAMACSRSIVRVSGEPSAHFAHKTRQLKRG